jgi:hypothetical protein
VSAFGGANLIEDPNPLRRSDRAAGPHAEEAVGALIAELDQLKAEQITDHELQRTKNQFARDYICSANPIGRKRCNWAMPSSLPRHPHGGRRIRHLSEHDGNDVQRVADVFPSENRLILTILPSNGPGSGDDEEPGAHSRIRRRATRRRSRSDGSVAHEGPPRPLAARRPVPPYEMRTLDNGLQVVAVLHHEQPLVSMRMIVRGGGTDPRGEAGHRSAASLLIRNDDAGSK